MLKFIISFDKLAVILLLMLYAGRSLRSSETFKEVGINSMGNAQGLSHTDSWVQILALQLDNHVAFTRCSLNLSILISQVGLRSTDLPRVWEDVRVTRDKKTRGALSPMLATRVCLLLG